MTTQHTSDHEKPDHEPRAETWAHADSRHHAGKAPHNKKNWDRKTRRRHSMLAAKSSQDSALVQTENDALAEEPLSADPAAEIAPVEEPVPAPEPEVEFTSEPEAEGETEPGNESEPEPEAEAEPEPEPDSEPESEPNPEPAPEAELEPEPEAPQEQEVLPEPEGQKDQEELPKQEPPTPSDKLFEDDFDDEFYDSLEVSTPWSDDAPEQSREEVAEELIEERDQEQPAEDTIEEQAQEQAVEDAIEETEESMDAIEETADDLEDSVSDLDEAIEDRTPKPTRKPAKAKPMKRKQPKVVPAEQQKQQQRDRHQHDQQQQRQQHEQQKQQQRDRHQREQQQQQEQRKQRQRRQRYLKSPSLKQAFRSLLKLNAGAAWRETRCAIVTFFVLFSLVALAVADALPAVDAFNTAIISAVQSTRGTLDTFVVTLTTIGDFLPMAGLCLVVCLILWIAKKWDSLAFFVVNVVLALVCVQVLKLIFAVPRPTDETLVPLPQSFSFPSAHSFCSLIVFGLVGLLVFRALMRRGVSHRAAMIPGIILIVFAILVGISRIYVGVHWPSDVLGGWLLAGTWLSYVGALYTVGARQTASSNR